MPLTAAERASLNAANKAMTDAIAAIPAEGTSPSPGPGPSPGPSPSPDPGSYTKLAWPTSGFTRVGPVPMPKYYYFDVPAGQPPGDGRVQVTYASADQYDRYMKISEMPGGAPMGPITPGNAPAGEVPSARTPTINFKVSQQDPWKVTLLPGHRYFVDITNVGYPEGSNTSMYVELYP